MFLKFHRICHADQRLHTAVLGQRPFYLLLRILYLQDTV